MKYVYVLYDKLGKKFYIGLTSDLKRRLNEHNFGKNHTTHRFKSIRLIFYEAFIAEIDAKRREGYFKTTKGKRALRLMLRNTF